MALFISSLNSGSNANCYYVGNENEGVLIDAGLSCRETERRMNRLNIPMSKVRAIFVSHEHSDHITGIAGITKKFQLPVYFTAATFRTSGIPVSEGLVKYFQPEIPVKIGSLEVKGFRKRHDAVDPHSFTITDGMVKVGVFTDIGSACNSLIDHFSQCHAAFLESNYCESMLEKGNYPYHLKKRISGSLGHLSNHQALELFVKHRSNALSHLVLSHLSRNNNHPDVVAELFHPHAAGTHLHVASRYAESPVFCVDGNFRQTVAPGLPRSAPRQLQLSLF